MTEAGSAGEYVLGTNEAELARLTLQQEVWGGVTEAFLDGIRLRPGARCLDVGCGPGLLVESLRRRVGRAGRVDALDESPVWHARLERLARERGWEDVSLLRGRVEDVPLEPAAYDLVLARWVLSFVPDVAAVVARLARALAPGGVLAVQDYNHEGVSLFPESQGFRAVVAATRRLYASGGGNAWVAGRLPRDLRAAGLVLERYEPTVLCGGPSSGAFRWADAFFPVHADRMVARGLLEPGARDAFLAEWDARRRDPDAVFFSPILVSLAARRPS